eukprot:5123541-Pyramimonas_sp.AAC.1
MSLRARKRAPATAHASVRCSCWPVSGAGLSQSHGCPTGRIPSLPDYMCIRRRASGLRAGAPS